MVKQENLAHRKFRAFNYSFDKKVVPFSTYIISLNIINFVDY